MVRKKVAETVSRSGLARVLDVTPARVSQLAAEGMPSIGGGRQGVPMRFRVSACQAWLAQRRRRKRAAVDIREARRRLTLSRVRGMEIRNRQTLARFIPADQVHAILTRARKILREEILSVPGRVSAAIAEEHDEVRLHTLLDDALRDALTRAADRVCPEEVRP